MTETTVLNFTNPAQISPDPLSDILREGARQLLAQAIEAEVAAHLAQHEADCLPDGRVAVVRNGYLPERTVQTGIGDIAVQVPKVRDRAGQGRKFTSSLIPPFLRRSASVNELLPALYLKGVSSGDFGEALEALLGKEAQGLSSSTISRLKQAWEAEYTLWKARDLRHKRYVYIWADGVHFHMRSNDECACMLVMIGVTELGRKELIAVQLGYSESAEHWRDVIRSLKACGLEHAPQLVIADGAPGFWNAVKAEWPAARHQRCWVHKCANVLSKLPKKVQKPAKSYLHQIWHADTKDNALQAYDEMEAVFTDKYPGAMACLTKDKDEMLAFYDFPAMHWHHIRTSNAIESVFATVRLRSNKTKSCTSEATLSAMVFKLAQSAEKRWMKIRGFDQLKNRPVAKVA
jgi:transposase-like protein